MTDGEVVPLHPEDGLQAQPHNVESEAALLGAILVDNKAFFAVCNDLRPVHFYEPVFARIFEAITSLIDDGGTASPLTLKPYFENDTALADLGGGGYLYDLAASVVTVVNAPEYATTIIDMWQRRELMQKCQSAIGELAQPDLETGAAEIGSGLQRDIEAAITAGSTRGTTRTEVLAAVVDDLQKPVRASLTGIGALDAAMVGGMHSGRAYGLVGRKKAGKSGLAGTISYNLNENGVKHLDILLEMGSLSYEQRSVARAVGFNAMKFLQPDARSDPAFASMVANYAVRATDSTFYLDQPGLSFDQLQQQVIYFAHKHGIKGFILDYLQLVGGRAPRQSMAEFLDIVSQWCATIVKQLDIWCLVCAQMNQDDNVRGGEAMRLAFDQVYALRSGIEENTSYLEMWDSRYTPLIDIGTKYDPALALDSRGPHFREITNTDNTEGLL